MLVPQCLCTVPVYTRAQPSHLIPVPIHCHLMPLLSALRSLCFPDPDPPGAGTNPVPIQTNIELYIR